MNKLWSSTLIGGGTILGLVLTCVAPFAAVAALAARTLPLRRALGVVAAMWLANQVVGFTALGYPHDAATVAWGVVVLAATALATAVASRIASTPLAFVAAFVAFESAQLPVAWAAGSLADYAPTIVAQVFAGNVLGFAVLAACGLVLRARVPRLR